MIENRAIPRKSQKASLDIFVGPEGGQATVRIVPSVGGMSRNAQIYINTEAARKLTYAHSSMSGMFYQEMTSDFEDRASHLFKQAVPELISCLKFAWLSGCEVISINGLKSIEAPTPIDGIVLEKNVQEPIFYLVGTICTGANLKGFSYATENKGKLLRAVAPVATNALSTSSQGYSADLGWHQDNANRRMIGSSFEHNAGQGPMNPYQCFITIRATTTTPMETTSLADLIAETVKAFGPAIVDELQKPLFQINRPDSHGGGKGVGAIPLIELLEDGLQSRFHAGNILGLTSTAQNAFDRFRSIAQKTASVSQWCNVPGSILIYPNTKVLHRRRKYLANFDGKTGIIFAFMR